MTTQDIVIWHICVIMVAKAVTFEKHPHHNHKHETSYILQVPKWHELCYALWTDFRFPHSTQYFERPKRHVLCTKACVQQSETKYSQNRRQAIIWAIDGPDNGLPPIRRQSIIWTNAGFSQISKYINFSEIWITIQNVSHNKIKFSNVIFKMSAILLRFTSSKVT